MQLMIDNWPEARPQFISYFLANCQSPAVLMKRDRSKQCTPLRSTSSTFSNMTFDAIRPAYNKRVTKHSALKSCCNHTSAYKSSLLVKSIRFSSSNTCIHFPTILNNNANRISEFILNRNCYYLFSTCEKRLNTLK